MSVDNAARSLPLAGLERLFRDMTAALAGAKACASQETGIRRTLSAQARLGSDDGTPAVGADAVAQRMCEFFGAGDDGRSPMWGSTFVSPRLGRCDFTGTAPVCGVSFAMRSARVSTLRCWLRAPDLVLRLRWRLMVIRSFGSVGGA
jgi:hypothetical protein